MSEYGDEARGEYGEGDDALEESAAAASANNSIIGKMRSSVSSILPNSLSKWFSPSANNNNNNENLNGSYGIATKRTRAETEDHISRIKIHPYLQLDDYQKEDNDDDGDGDGDDIEDDADESNYSDDIQMNAALSSVRRSRRILESSTGEFQPPSKRSRITLDETMLTVRPLIASTPAVNAQRNSGVVGNHYGHMNMYAGMNRKDIGYNFYGTPTSSAAFEQQNVAPDIIDLIPIPMCLNQNDAEASSEALHSRRTLNIPPTTATSSGSNTTVYALPTLKRQSLNVQRNVDTNLKSKQHNNQPYNDIEHYGDKNEGGLELEDSLNPQTYNGRVQTKFLNGAGDFEGELRQRSPPTDSEAEDADTLTDLPGVNTGNSSMLKGNTPQRGTSSGLFKMTAGNSRSGSRTSSFGNGLNFYTHLEGRKSLFAGPSSSGRTITGNALNSSTLSLNSLNRRQFNASIYGSTSALSDSRLLNTSSPFYKGNTTYGGAAAYSKFNNTLGSTSRLTPTLIRPTSSLSTLSSSSNSIAAGAGVTGFQGGENNPAISGTAKTILDLINGFTTPLSEAKKMATNLRQSNLPQSQAASTSFSKSKRLTDADIHASRAIRLQQVRTPYMRPMVMLQPKKQSADLQQMPPVRELQVPSMSQLLQMKKLQNSTERSRQITMQKASAHDCPVAVIQTTTKLPEVETQKNLLKCDEDRQKDVVDEVGAPITENKQQHQNQQQLPQQQLGQKHINKMKHKINSSLRAPATTENELPPLPADLPNIEFPQIKAMPKFDIVLKPNNTSSYPPIADLTKKQNDISKENSSKASNFLNSKSDGFTFSAPTELKIASTLHRNVVPSNVSFTFSQPESLNAIPNTATSAETKHKLQFENSGLPVVPGIGTSTAVSTSLSFTPYSGTQSFPKPTTMTTVPTLKTGSVLDALKKPIAALSAPTTTTNPTSLSNVTSFAQSSGNMFGNQFKKSANEWDCDACMVRNKNEVTKCVSCDTPRKTAASTEIAKSPQMSLPLSLGFGNQFAKASNEWECDTCMVRNKNDASKCISCETPRKSSTDTKLPSLPTIPLANTISTGFGMKFQKQAGEWECDTCMVRNKSDANKCVSCETARKGLEPNSTKPLTSQPFGDAFFKPTTTTTDAGFKSLAAAQKASTWECEACMTRNDSSCSKCVCCEQAKPGGGAQKTSAPSFSFGATAASKFSFGFGASKENDLRKSEQDPISKSTTATTSTTTILANTVKTEGVTSTNNGKLGLMFNAPVSAASTVQSSGFNIGFQTKPAVTTAGASVSAVSKDATDKPSGFTFGSGNTLSSKTSSTFSFGATTTTNTETATSGLKFTLSTSTASSTTSTATTVAAATTLFTPPKTAAFSFGIAGSAATTSSTPTSTTLTASIVKPQEGFSFGFPNQNQSAANAKSSGFVFSSTTKPQTTTTTTAIIEPSKAAVIPGSTFDFKGVATTSSTIATTTTTNSVVSKPMFSFGISSMPSISNTTSSSSSTGTTTTTVAANTGFLFGTKLSSGASDTKPVFGLGTTPATTTASSSSNTSITFGTFASPKTNTSNDAAAATAATNAPPTFGSFNFKPTTTTATSGKIDSGNLFGSMVAKTQAQDEQNLAPAAKQIFANTSAHTSSEASSSNAWPKNTFLFGNGGKTATSGETATASSVFGGLKPEATTTPATAPVANVNPTPLFEITSNSSSTPAFGSSNIASSNIFGTNAAPALQNTTTLFGSKDNNVPQFGSMGNSGIPAANTTSTFGSALTNVAPVTFGGFGAAAAATPNSTTKIEPITQSTTPFRFEAPQAQAPTSGFNFGSAAANTTRPAFNFTSTYPPTFNFTGGSTETTQPTTRPFQFGAAGAAPSFNPSSVFSFGGAPSIETSSNTPFQFNAGATPTANNIFAPAPTASTTTQAVRRKVRIPTRRMTPR